MKDFVVFEIAGEVPSKKNSRRLVTSGGRVRSLPSAAHEKWHRGAVLAIRSQNGGKPLPCRECVRVDCAFFHGDKRRRDHNNQMASILDLLVDAGVIADDSWDIVGEESCRGEYRKGRAGARIEITILGGDR